MEGGGEPPFSVKKFPFTFRKNLVRGMTIILSLIDDDAVPENPVTKKGRDWL